MNDLISRSALLEKLSSEVEYDDDGQQEIDSDIVFISIDYAPTVDAVEVVWCKDCKNFERRFEGCGYCYYWDYEQGMSPNSVDDNDFCSYGERKESEST